MKTPLILTLLLAILPCSEASTFWISPTGRDDGPGTATQPFASLQRALAAIQESGTRLPGESVTVRLLSGTYRLAAPVEITADAIGAGERKVTFMAEPGHRAVIVGSRTLRGPWVHVRSNLWRTTIPEAAAAAWRFRSLFRDGKWQQRSREPDTGYFTVADMDGDRRRITLQPALPEAWTGAAGVEINSIAHWHYNRQSVAELNGSTVIVREPVGSDASGARLAMKSHNRLWLENSLVFADEPGEWYLDAARGELFYCAQPGDDPNHSSFSAPVTAELMVVRGTPQQPVRNLEFRNLEFAETEWEMPAEGRMGLQAGAWGADRSRTYSPTAAIRFLYCSNIVLQGCHFRDLGEGALALEAGCSDGLIASSSFRRVGANVIQVGRMPAYTGIGHPLHRDFVAPRDRISEEGAIPGAGDLYRTMTTTAAEAPSRIRIVDNTIEDCLHLDLGSVGIWVGYASHVRIEHNLLRNLPYTGISVGWRWAPGLTNCHSNLVAFNRVEGVMREAGDGGGIYLVGEQPGTKVLNNYVRDSRGSYSERGIYIDEFGDHMEIAGNYVAETADRSIYLHKNGPNQSLHDNNGDSGPTQLTPLDSRGRRWIKYLDERTPPDLSLYGPR